MKKIKIDKEKCIGCGLCASIAEEIFKMNDDGKAETIKGSEKVKDPACRQAGFEKKTQEAIDNCPVTAISW